MADDRSGICEGAPEDLMLTGTVAKAFESPLLTFSQHGRNFQLHEGQADRR